MLVRLFDYFFAGILNFVLEQAHEDGAENSESNQQASPNPLGRSGVWCLNINTTGDQADQIIIGDGLALDEFSIAISRQKTKALKNATDFREWCSEIVKHKLA